MSVLKSVELKFTIKQIITITTTTTTTTTQTTTPSVLIKKLQQLIKSAPVPNMDELQITTMSEFLFHMLKNFIIENEKNILYCFILILLLIVVIILYFKNK